MSGHRLYIKMVTVTHLVCGLYILKLQREHLGSCLVSFSFGPRSDHIYMKQKKGNNKINKEIFMTIETINREPKPLIIPDC